MFWNLEGRELGCVYYILMSKKGLQLKPSKFPTLAKSSVFPIKMLPKRNLLDFLNKGTRWSMWEARVVIFSGDQEHANVMFAEAPATAHLRTVPSRYAHRLT